MIKRREVYWTDSGILVRENLLCRNHFPNAFLQDPEIAKLNIYQNYIMNMSKASLPCISGKMPVNRQVLTGVPSLPRTGFHGYTHNIIITARGGNWELSPPSWY